MIIAGIDEAGLGPALGVLAVGATAWEISDEPALTAEVFLNNRKAIADSKIVFPHRGVRGLEAPLLALWENWQPAKRMPENRLEFFTTLGAENFLALADELWWYRDVEWQFPAAAKLNEIAELSAAQNPAIKIRALWARVATERELNRRFIAMNKARAAWREVAELIAKIARFAAGNPARIIIDKQGGRNFYAPLLMELFPRSLITSLTETAASSEYQIDNLNLLFVPRADRDYFPVSLAGMLAKYIRERCMNDFNAWFIRQLPGLKPTAGYHGDAPRFRDAVLPLLARYEIPATHFWRDR